MSNENKTKEQAQLEAAIKKGGMETANIWLKGAMKNGPVQAGNTLEMLRHACTFFLATYTVNKSNPECFQPPVDQETSVKEIEQMIKDYAEMIGTDTQTIYKLKTEGENNA